MSRQLALVVSLALMTVGACGKTRLKVAEEDPTTPNDYGRTELLGAAQSAAAANSAKAFRTFAVRTLELSPRFSESVKIEAERALVFMAIEPMRAVFDKTPIEQREALALTVWPSAFNIEPKPGETAATFVERICGDKLALKCKYAVAEYRPLLLASLAWRNIKARAREAYVLCDVCSQQPRYKQLLQSLDKHDRIMSGRAGNVEDAAHPRAWPFAGKAAKTWSNSPVLAIALDGNATFLGRRTKAGKWRDAIARTDTPTGPLGVYLRPKDRVRTLRAVLADAAAVGYDQVALQVRSREYPYPLREYRLVTTAKTKPKPRLLMIRDIDTIQVLVQSVDANSKADGPPLTLGAAD